MLLENAYRLFSRTGLRADSHVRLGIDDGGYTQSHNRMIIHHQNPHLLPCGHTFTLSTFLLTPDSRAGTTIDNCVPFPGALFISKCPPTSSTLSRIPIIPKCAPWIARIFS